MPAATCLESYWNVRFSQRRGLLAPEAKVETPGVTTTPRSGEMTNDLKVEKK
jgi:hypothetical protein